VREIKESLDPVMDALGFVVDAGDREMFRQIG